MSTNSFREFYNNYTNDPTRKIAVEQYEKQLKAAILLTQLRVKEDIHGKEPTHET